MGRDAHTRPMIISYFQKRVVQGCNAFCSLSIAAAIMSEVPLPPVTYLTTRSA